MEESDTVSTAASAQLVDLEERRLVPRYAGGDWKAFEELLQRYKAPVYGYLVRCGVDPATRDDLFQEAFCRIHAAAASYRPEHPLKSWIFTIVANVVRTHFRRKRIQEMVFRPEVRESADLRPDSQQAAELKESAAWLEKTISELPLPQREVIVLSCIEQMSHEEISKSLGIPVNTVKTHLRRARLTLASARARARTQLEREVSS